MQNFTASVEILTNEDDDLVGSEVTVDGLNLSEELITMLAKHATAVDLGVGNDELESRLSDWDVIEHGPESSVCVLRFIY